MNGLRGDPNYKVGKYFHDKSYFPWSCINSASYCETPYSSQKVGFGIEMSKSIFWEKISKMSPIFFPLLNFPV